MKKSIQACDEDLGYLLDAIEKDDKLRKNLHLIVTSDHGLEQVDATNSPMYLETFVDLNKLRAFGTKTVINVFVNAGEYPFTRFTLRRESSSNEVGETHSAAEKY